MILGLFYSFPLKWDNFIGYSINLLNGLAAKIIFTVYKLTAGKIPAI